MLPGRGRLRVADASRLLLWVVTAVALVLGPATAVWSLVSGHALDHDDARSHLLVARRVLDNSRPGLGQLGGVWLPLPHLLNALPVQADVFYRTGASAVAISVAGYLLAIASLVGIVIALTHSRAAALAAVAVLGFNPNVLYLTGTPMTEPLCVGLLLAGLSELLRSCEATPRGRAHLAGVAFAGACLTRYEAWTVTCAVCALALTVLRDRGADWRNACRIVASVAAWPLVAVAAFALHSHRTTGAWLVMSGFFAPDNREALRHPVVAADQLFTALCTIAPWSLVAIGSAATLLAAARSLDVGARSRSPRLALALWAAAVPPVLAFVQGHPVHVRFATMLVPAVAVGIALAVSSLPARASWVGAVLTASCLLPAGLGSMSSAIAMEARRGGPQRVADHGTLACLAAAVSHEDRILASLGAVAPEVQQLGGAGVPVRQFVHEGLGGDWVRALASPVSRVRWILMADAGTDPVAAHAAADPSFLHGFTEPCGRGERIRVFERVERPADSE